MDYIKTFKSFINSHYVSEGVRITTGVLLPAFILGYFDLLATGIIVCIGALFVSVTDGPGPIHHRKNGMQVCIAAIFIITLLAGFASKSPVALAVLLVAACFFFSMISIYGARAASIGTATMLVLTLSIDPRLNLSTPSAIIEHTLWMTSGGIWYMCFSMLLHNFRPYRLAQQALGDYIQETSVYLLLRSELYKKGVNYEHIFRQLLQQQAVVQNKQEELTELLFKTRSIVKESTPIGRTLVMIHLDVADIFEGIMMQHQKYSLLHDDFDETGILNDYYKLAQEMGAELNDIGIAVKSGERSALKTTLFEHITKTKEKLESLRATHLNPDNIEGFISLRRIIENIQDLAERLNALRKYTAYDNKINERPIKQEDYEKMITSQAITADLFINNLTLRSDTFRHSVRVSIAVLVGYITALFFNIGHSYWILLTIVVILKPAFSLTKKRNASRLAGTFAGIIIGVSILSVIDHSTILLAILIILMAGSYSFMRTNYFVSVLLMTPYLIIFYHLLNPKDFNILLKDRIIDTIIGSLISFIASVFLFPSWEREKIKTGMITMLSGVKNYFSVVSGQIAGKAKDKAELQLARKSALVALANLSDAFNRMLSEPKWQQKGFETLHQFVVLNHMLTSYIATLSHYILTQPIPIDTKKFMQVATDIERYFSIAIANLSDEESETEMPAGKEHLRTLNEQANELLQKRKQELQQGLLDTDTRDSLVSVKSVVDQFNLIYNVVLDLNKITQALNIR